MRTLETDTERDLSRFIEKGLLLFFFVAIVEKKQPITQARSTSC